MVILHSNHSLRPLTINTTMNVFLYIFYTRGTYIYQHFRLIYTFWRVGHYERRREFLLGGFLLCRTGVCVEECIRFAVGLTIFSGIVDAKADICVINCNALDFRFNVDYSIVNSAIPSGRDFAVGEYAILKGGYKSCKIENPKNIFCTISLCKLT